MQHLFSTLCSKKLNLTDKSRVSRFAWRGQFSPELIEYLLKTIFKDAETIYDPFSGSGTVLFEASLLNKTALGSEINPAAWCLSSTIHLNQLSPSKKNNLINEIELILSPSNTIDIDKIIESIQYIEDIDLKTSLTAILLDATGNNTETNLDKLQKSKDKFIHFIKTISQYKGNAHSYLEDCRSTCLASNSIDAVITSPPYINVFNYHQNYRPIMEKLGWFPLTSAKSEIGANRKFRQNRFLTVIQYTQDLGQTINELSRTMKKGSTGVLIVGRESKVLGERFYNSDIIMKLFDQHPSLTKTFNTERAFINKFGQTIYEDLIFFEKNSMHKVLDLSSSTNIGLSMLTDKLPEVNPVNMELIMQAISKGNILQPSPLFNTYNLWKN